MAARPRARGLFGIVGAVPPYRSWFPRPDPRASVGFERRTHRFAPMFSPTRMPADAIHVTAAGFTYASGRNPTTGVRYRVGSIPIWLPAVIASLVLGKLLVRRLIPD